MLQLGSGFLGPPRAQALLVATPAEWQSTKLERSGETQEKAWHVLAGLLQGAQSGLARKGGCWEGVHREK